VCAQENTQIVTGAGGSVMIGVDTHLHRGCQLSAYKEAIRIGERVEIAARCAFYPFDHGIEAGRPIAEQPLTSKGPKVPSSSRMRPGSAME
jgi:acetyltransferase-like isoleucine patch superfamily enzyme